MFKRRSLSKKKPYYKRKFTKRSGSARTAFSSNRSTMVRLTSVISIQASQLKAAPLVFSTHAPVYWYSTVTDSTITPNALPLRSLNRITNALSLY